MIQLIDDNIYWIKHNELLNRCEGKVCKSDKNKEDTTLVRVVKFDKTKNAYIVVTIGRDLYYGISVDDIKDVKIVVNPFKIR